MFYGRRSDKSERSKIKDHPLQKAGKLPEKKRDKKAAFEKEPREAEDEVREVKLITNW